MQRQLHMQMQRQRQQQEAQQRAAQHSPLAQQYVKQTPGPNSSPALDADAATCLRASNGMLDSGLQMGNTGAATGPPQLQAAQHVAALQRQNRSASAASGDVDAFRV